MRKVDLTDRQIILKKWRDFLILVIIIMITMSLSGFSQTVHDSEQIKAGQPTKDSNSMKYPNSDEKVLLKKKTQKQTQEEKIWKEVPSVEDVKKAHTEILTQDEINDYRAKKYADIKTTDYPSKDLRYATDGIKNIVEPVIKKMAPKCNEAGDCILNNKCTTVSLSESIEIISLCRKYVSEYEEAMSMEVFMRGMEWRKNYEYALSLLKK
ncbi:MAG: hypothetical protein LBQ47_01105 [Endomicrobium sp.]|jgi:hypothetical protein|nr:hypothetical protein [Endomicrobium sp.]